MGNNREYWQKGNSFMSFEGRGTPNSNCIYGSGSQVHYILYYNRDYRYIVDERKKQGEFLWTRHHTDRMFESMWKNIEQCVIFLAYLKISTFISVSTLSLFKIRSWREFLKNRLMLFCDFQENEQATHQQIVMVKIRELNRFLIWNLLYF